MPTIPWLPGAFGGFDKRDPPSVANPKPPNGDGRYNVDRAAEWMKNLLYLSNFSFTGHYLTHSYQGGFKSTKFRQLWKEIFKELLSQGWGFWLICLEIPQYLDPKDKNAKDNIEEWSKVKSGSMTPVELGISHAQRLKRDFLAPLEHEAQGAIVYVDFEDEILPPATVREDVKAYYTAIFSELRRLDEHNIAVRPGLYARFRIVPQFVGHAKSNVDLFLWQVDQDHDYQSLATPFSRQGGRLYSPIEKHPIRGFTFEDYDTKARRGEARRSGDQMPDQRWRTTVLIGRQWILFKGQMPDLKQPLRGLPPEPQWDYDVCLVRDPRWPIALPRIAVSTDICLRTVFGIPVDQGTGQRQPSTGIEQVYYDWPVKLPLGSDASHVLEHEAPLILLPQASKGLAKQFSSGENSFNVPGIGPEIVTFCRDGKLAVISSFPAGNPAGSLTWSSPQFCLDKATRMLRRNRAVAVSKSSGPDSIETQIFFVSSDHRLIVIRRSNFSAWSSPTAVTQDKTVHPFSSIAGSTREEPSTGPVVNIADVFLLDLNGALCVATCSAADNLPISKVAEAGGTYTILQGTSMAAVSPTRDESVCFVIDQDCNLCIAVYDAKNTSVTLSRVNLDTKADKLYPHAKMDALLVSQDLVYVACLTEVMTPCVYHMVRTGSGWQLGDKGRIYLENRLHTPGPSDPRSLFEAAPGLPDDYNPEILRPSSRQNVARNVSVGYAFNPLGDIKLSMVGADLTIWMAGITMTATKGFSGDRTALLFRRVLVPDKAGECWKRVK